MTFHSDQAVPMDTEEAIVTKQKKRRGPKRKRERLEIEEPLGKRRSARVSHFTFYALNQGGGRTCLPKFKFSAKFSIGFYM